MTNIVEEIRQNPKPLDISTWWKQQPPTSMADPLDDEEEAYLAFFTSEEVEPILRVGRGIAAPDNLTAEERDKAKQRFGTDPNAIQRFVNYENRRRIIAHYVLTHPATVQYEIGLYRLSRDVNPVTFIGERIYEIITGTEAFTDEKISRLRAGVDVLIPMIIGGVLKLVRVTPIAPVSTRALTDPIYDLPPAGGGIRINGRWYTEHALERMAPDTPQVRAELRARVVARLKRIGLNENSPAWGPCLERGLKKIDPRGVPPSVVEAEISKPGSTNVTVVKAKGGQIVVTVIPKKGK